MDTAETKILSFKQDIKLVYINDAASDGVQVLSDLKRICNEADLGDTFTFT